MLVPCGGCKTFHVLHYCIVYNFWSDLIIEKSTEDVQEERQSTHIHVPYQWHNEELQTNQGKQYTSHKYKKSKATRHPKHSPGITKTCQYNVTILNPTFVSKTGVYKGIHYFFLFLLKNINCGYSLEPPHRGGSNEYPQFMF